MFNDYSAFQDEIVGLRRHLHMFPETALSEYKTTWFIKNYLEDNGYTVNTASPTGCTAFLSVNEGYPTVAVRAEMDAVPMKEKTKLFYASKNSRAMHSCGHDANMAVALVLARICALERESLSCNVKFIFEPAEETGSGAEIMINSGALENPKVDAFIMFHFANKDSYGVEVNENIATAAIGRIDIRLHGVSGHWAAKSKSRDALLAASQLLTEIENINSSFDSPYPFCVGIGKMSGGSSANVIADYAEMNGNLRTCTMGDYNSITQLIKNAAENISVKTGVRIETEISSEPITPIVNDPFMVKKACSVGKKVFGDRFFLTDKLYLAGDNACLYFNRVPGVFMVFRSELPDGPPLHNPKFILNEQHFYKALEMLHTYLTDIYR